jgi:TetR/AcrR family transcriptional repressor of nem operon
MLRRTDRAEEDETMRYKSGHKAQTHRAIVAAAACQLRTSGIGGVSIGGLMQQVQLTHGGFYEHFASKDALIIETIQQAFQSGETLVAQAENQPPEGRIAWFIRCYLSRTHRDHPESGCMLPALASDIARQSAPVRAAFAEALAGYCARLAALLPGTDDAAKLAAAHALLASMAGAIALARATADSALSDALLADTRHALLARYVPPASLIAPPAAG